MTHTYVPNLLGALGLALGDRLAEASELAGGSSAAAALVALYGRGAGTTIDGLARVCGLSHSGAVRLVDRLAGEGWVERRRGADQRSAALRLTPPGRRAARRVMARRDAEMQYLLGLLTDGEQTELGRLAARLLAALSAASESERRLCRLCDLEACGRSKGTCPVASSRRGRRLR